jgi:hypothetical protein
MDDLRLLQDLHGLTYHWWWRRQEDGQDLDSRYYHRSDRRRLGGRSEICTRDTRRTLRMVASQHGSDCYDFTDNELYWVRHVLAATRMLPRLLVLSSYLPKVGRALTKVT